jgi:hypothetical protein
MKTFTRDFLVDRLSCRGLAMQLVRCLRDDRGVAMTEYLIVGLVTLPLIFILFDPNNGFYEAARSNYEKTRILLVFPGP